MLSKAINIAVKAHLGQIDKAGEPYILHPLRVMLSSSTENERICAVLHDVLEDSEITFDDLRKEGFSEEIITALDCLTKREGESYYDFISRVITDETACHVKFADLRDNMNLYRISNPSEKDIERMKQYQEASDRIFDALPMLERIKDARIIEIQGCVSVQPYISHDEFMSKFITFIEANGWSFGGGSEDVTDKQWDEDEQEQD